jgi:hypothetical protein
MYDRLSFNHARIAGSVPSTCGQHSLLSAVRVRRRTYRDMLYFDESSVGSRPHRLIERRVELLERDIWDDVSCGPLREDDALEGCGGHG